MYRSFRNRALTNLAVFILLEAASLYFLTHFGNDKAIWIGETFTKFQTVFWKPVEALKSISLLKKENEDLAEENYRLMKQLVVMAKKQESSREWSFIRNDFSTIPACIVTMTSGSQHNYIIVDKGKADGVETGDGIITSQGIVGIVRGTTEHYSFALSFNNQEMVISTRLGHDGPVGAMRWTGLNGRTSLMTGIPIHFEIETGDSVFTSGFSSIFPADLPLGTVKETRINSGSVCDATIELFEDFSSLKWVMVVKNLNKEEIDSLSYDN